MPAEDAGDESFLDYYQHTIIEICVMTGLCHDSALHLQMTL